MEDRFTKILSLVFHPLFIPFYMMLVLLNINRPFAQDILLKTKLILTSMVFVSTILLPLMIVFLLYRLKMVRSFYMEQKEERIYPLLTLAIFYYITYYLLKGFSISFFFSYYMLGSTFLTILAMIISFYRKISLHMIGIGGMLGLLMGISLNLSLDLTWFVIGAIILGGLLGFARIQSNSHKPSDIYSGFLLGAGVMFLLFIFL
jgi:hypothetical protein